MKFERLFTKMILWFNLSRNFIIHVQIFNHALIGNNVIGIYVFNKFFFLEKSKIAVSIFNSIKEIVIKVKFWIRIPTFKKNCI